VRRQTSLGLGESGTGERYDRCMRLWATLPQSETGRGAARDSPFGGTVRSGPARAENSRRRDCQVAFGGSGGPLGASGGAPQGGRRGKHTFLPRKSGSGATRQTAASLRAGERFTGDANIHTAASSSRSADPTIMAPIRRFGARGSTRRASRHWSAVVFASGRRSDPLSDPPHDLRDSPRWGAPSLKLSPTWPGLTSLEGLGKVREPVVQVQSCPLGLDLAIRSHSRFTPDGATRTSSLRGGRTSPSSGTAVRQLIRQYRRRTCRYRPRNAHPHGYSQGTIAPMRLRLSPEKLKR